VGGIGFPSQTGLVDRVGQPVLDSDVVIGETRSGLRTPSQPQTGGPADDVKSAMAKKSAAYERLRDSLRSTSEGDRWADVTKAISDYKAADAELKAIAEKAAGASR
jgi:hypothetical protein